MDVLPFRDKGVTPPEVQEWLQGASKCQAN